MLDLHRFNPINLLIYGGTKMVYNKVMREASQPSNTIQIPESQIPMYIRIMSKINNINKANK